MIGLVNYSKNDFSWYTNGWLCNILYEYRHDNLYTNPHIYDLQLAPELWVLLLFINN